MKFKLIWTSTGRTVNSLEPRFFHQNQTLNPFKPLQKAELQTAELQTCSARNRLNPGPNPEKLNFEPRFIYQNQTHPHSKILQKTQSLNLQPNAKQCSQTSQNGTFIWILEHFEMLLVLTPTVPRVLCVDYIIIVLIISY